MQEKQTGWILKALDDEQQRLSKELAEELGVSEHLSNLLISRGVHTFEQARAFFRPSMTQLHDPFLIKDMDKAVERLNKAMRNKENILIYGDYDVDGTTAVALVYKFLHTNLIPGQSIDIYIPDRYKEGYGVSKEGIDYAREKNITLIITLDCGIKAHEQVRYAAQWGIDVIICDHHTTDDTLPDAVAVLDSKRADDDYPYEHLSGCGVGYKFMTAFAISNGLPLDSLEQYLDLLAVSIASDIVPITGENRVLAYFGIKRLNENPSCGLRAIWEVCNKKESYAKKSNTVNRITINDIVFKIGPRINASGRLKTGRDVVELLVCNDIAKARQISKNIDETNTERREIDQNTTNEAINQIKENEQSFKQRRSIVVYNPNWSKGIVGIVASRLVEEYYKPTIVLTKSSEMITGSARSVSGFDLYKAVDSCRDLLENFGGHTYAAGLSLKEENLEAFIERFEDYVSKNIEQSQLTPQIEIDAVLKFADITPKFVRILKQFEPFGPCNTKPIFCTKRVYDYNGESRPVGKDEEHLKLELTDSSCDEVMNGIAFRMASYDKQLKELTPLDILYTIEDNTFNNVTTTQLMIKDIRESKKE